MSLISNQNVLIDNQFRDARNDATVICEEAVKGGLVAIASTIAILASDLAQESQLIRILISIGLIVTAILTGMKLLRFREARARCVESSPTSNASVWMKINSEYCEEFKRLRHEDTVQNKIEKQKLILRLLHTFEGVFYLLMIVYVLAAAWCLIL